MRHVIRLLLALVLGAGSGAAVLHWSTGDDRYAWVWMAAMPVLVVGFVILTIARTVAGMAPADPAAVQAARAAGRLAGAKVVDLRRTGTEINDVPQYELELLVDPRDRSPYRTTVRELIDAARMPSRLPGTVLAVVRLGADTPDVVVVDEPAPPVRVHATPDAPIWKADPDARVPGRRRPLLPTGRRGRGVRVVVYVLVAALGALLPTWQARDDVLLGIRSGGVGHGDASYLSGPDRVTRAVEAFTGASGGSTVTEVLVYDDQVLLTAPTEPGRTAYDSWWAVATRSTRERPATIQPEPTDEFDLTTVDWSVLPTLYERALASSGIPSDELDGHIQHIGVERSSFEEGAPVQIRVFLSGDYGSYSLTADATGTVLEQG